MRKIILNSAIAMAMGTLSIAGHAAESASMSVVGEINPASCDVSLSAASIDLGSIMAATLTETANVKNGEDITVNLSCDAPAAVALQSTDNRASSAMTTAEVTDQMSTTIVGATDTNLFGLGVDSASEKVGVLMLGITGSTLEGAANPNLLSSNDMSAWTANAVSPTSGMLLEKDGYFASASTAADTVPVAVTNATYTLSSAIYLKNSAEYPTGETVNLDGNVTFSVVYL